MSLKRMQHLTTYLWFLVLTKTLLASSDSGPGSSNKVALYNKQNGGGGGGGGEMKLRTIFSVKALTSYLMASGL